MPESLRGFLKSLCASEKAELAEYIMTTDDNEVTTEMVSVLEEQG